MFVPRRTPFSSIPTGAGAEPAFASLRFGFEACPPVGKCITVVSSLIFIGNASPSIKYLNEKLRTSMLSFDPSHFVNEILLPVVLTNWLNVASSSPRIASARDRFSADARMRILADTTGEEIFFFKLSTTPWSTYFCYFFCKQLKILGNFI